MLLPRVAGAEICVLVPHFKDEYWLSVGYGIQQEAAARDLEPVLHEAGGYRARDRQIEQIGDCLDQGADAILIGAVSSDHPDLLDAVAGAARSVPVFALVNALHSDALSGMIGVDWQDMGAVLGAELARRYPGGQGVRNAVLVSGPAEAGWVAPLETGLRAALAGSAVRILAVHAADTGLRQQFAALSRALAEGPSPDILIGSGPAIEAAMGYLAAHPGQPRPLLAATYTTHSIRRGLSNGSIAAAVFDDPVAQGRMAVRMISGFLETGQVTEATGPRIVLIRGTDPGAAELALSPADYFPAIR